MALPLLVMPFLTAIFWALGGGQGTAANTTQKQRAGLNPELPNAQFDRDMDEWDKLSLYQKARRDSMRYHEARRIDPYFKLMPLKEDQDTVKKPKSGSGNVNPSLGKKDPWIDENEERVNRKLEELYRSLNAPPESEKSPRYESNVPQVDDERFSNDVEKLEDMMRMMQAGDAEDKEMQEIQAVLEKILDIQHPERVQERLRSTRTSDSSEVFTVHPLHDQAVGLISAPADSESPVELNQFYGIDRVNTVNSAPEFFQAAVYDAQTLVSGSVIKLKLMTDIYVSGMLIPAGRFLYGVCALNGERLTASINSIHHANQIFPVSLSVFDLDGLEGIYIPGAIARDVAKQSSNQAVQGLQLGTFNPSLEMQAASAGIETAQNLIAKKTRLIKVTVKAGYRVLLMDTGNR